MRKIVICAPVSSFVAVSGCFRFPSPTPELKAPAAKIKSPQIYGNISDIKLKDNALERGIP
jgi:hypothetical protein